MSGIAGVFYKGGLLEPVQLRRMMAAIAHRGPDGHRVWHAEAVGLGHCALYTTPEACREQQPQPDATGRFVVTADARIDNRDDLLRALGLWGVVRPSVTDAALVLAAYRKWGVDCCAHLIGDFAFAIWDERDQRLFCARDHMGIRPFYYYDGADVFAFGSEIKALLAHKRVPRKINEIRVAEYLAKTGTDPAITFYEGIVRLPPAHALVVERSGAVRMWRYWNLDPERETRLPSDEAYEARFLELFTDAVKCRMRSTTPVGVSLSGGLDSSSVACVAQNLLAADGVQPLDTFSAVFPDLPAEERTRADESRYLDVLEQQGGFQMHRIPLDTVSPLEQLDRVIWHLDQPPFICNVYLINALLSAATAEGVRVMLDGAEGDVVVSYGMGVLGEFLLNGRWAALERNVRALGARHGASAKAVFRKHLTPFLEARASRHPWQFVLRDAHRAAVLSGRSRRQMLWQHLIKPHMPQPLREAVRTFRGREAGESPFHPIISRDLVRRTALRERIDAQREAFRTERYSERRRHWAALHLDVGSIAAVQEESSHLAAMLGGERRHPFYDVRLIEYCVSLPSDQKLRNGWTRSILRRAMKGILPEPVRQRTDKGDLSPNFNRHLLRDVQASSDCWGLNNHDLLAPYLDLEVLDEARKRKDAPLLWSAVVLARWLEGQKSDGSRDQGSRLDLAHDAVHHAA